MGHGRHRSCRNKGGLGRGSECTSLARAQRSGPWDPCLQQSWHALMIRYLLAAPSAPADCSTRLLPAATRAPARHLRRSRQPVLTCTSHVACVHVTLEEPGRSQAPLQWGNSIALWLAVWLLHTPSRCGWQCGCCTCQHSWLEPRGFKMLQGGPLEGTLPCMHSGRQHRILSTAMCICCSSLCADAGTDMGHACSGGSQQISCRLQQVAPQRGLVGRWRSGMPELAALCMLPDAACMPQHSEHAYRA